MGLPVFQKYCSSDREPERVSMQSQEGGVIKCDVGVTGRLSIN